MAETTLQLGFVPKNRGEYQNTPVTRYYKDNVVQYNGSSYIADPIGWSESDPTATYVTIVPTDENGNLNAGWRVFASGNNTFTTGEKVDNVGIDSEPTAGSDNLVKSNGVFEKTQLLTDAIGNVDLSLITFTDHTYINTASTILPNDGLSITPTSTGSLRRSAVIPVLPGDSFVLNNIGGVYGNTAFVFANSSFSIIKRSEANHTCNEEVVVAPQNAAWLCLNDYSTDKRSYKGKNVTEKINIVKQNLQRQIDIQADNVGGINIETISFIGSRYIDTSGNTIPNDGTEITLSTNSGYRCATIPVSEGDKFFLNNVGYTSKQRAYAWAKSDFSKISDSGDSHTCVYETIIAPAGAAWLVLNDKNSDKNCYKGTSFLYDINEKILIEKNRAELSEKNLKDTFDTKTTIIPETTITLDKSSSGASTQNIINRSNLNIKAGSYICIDINSIQSINYSRLRLNGSSSNFAEVSESPFIFKAETDITAIRLFANKDNIRGDEDTVNITVSVSVLGIYESLKNIEQKQNNIDDIQIRNESADVFCYKNINTIWHPILLLNNNAYAVSSEIGMTSDFIPVDTISVLKVSCSNDISYDIFKYDENKNFINRSYYTYTGEQIFEFNNLPTFKQARTNFNKFTRFIKIRVNNSNNTNDIQLTSKSLFSQFNNRRLLNNKNIKCFGHRGSPLRSDGIADNFPSAIWGCYINGFDGVHVNIRFSTDHVPYCLHDGTFIGRKSDGQGGWIYDSAVAFAGKTSTELDEYERAPNDTASSSYDTVLWEPLAKVESAVYMAKIMGLDVILYNIYGLSSTPNDDYDALINIVKKYGMFEHTWFGITGAVGSPTTAYLSKVATVYPKANILRTQSDITSTNYQDIVDLIADANNILTNYPDLNICLWLNSQFSKNDFIQANIDKPYNVKLGVHSLTKNKYQTILPYIDIYTYSGGESSFGSSIRDVEISATTEYPEFLGGNYGNII